MRSLKFKGEAQRNYASCLSPTHNGSSEIQRFEHCDAIEIRDGINIRFLHETATFSWAVDYTCI